MVAIPGTISCLTISMRACLIVKQVKGIAKVSQTRKGHCTKNEVSH